MTRGPVFTAVAGMTAGILLSRFAGGYAGIIAIGFPFAAIIFYKLRTNFLHAGLFLMFACCGYIHALNFDSTSPRHIEHNLRFHRNKPAVLRGQLVSDVTERRVLRTRKFSAQMSVREIKAPWGWEPAEGKVLVQYFRDAGLEYGDVFEAKGRLHRPYNFESDSNFSYRQYLRNKGIRAVLSVKNEYPVVVLSSEQKSPVKKFCIRMRGKFRAVLEKYLTENEAGIMKAVLIGDRGNIPKHIRELFSRTGSAHILAISGLHIGVVAGIFLLFVRILPLPGKFQFLSAVILLWSYVLMTEGRPSVIRASFMFTVVLVGKILEKDPGSLNSLTVAALFLLAVNPLTLFDIGFQLSFACVAGIIILSPVLQEAMCRICGGHKKLAGALSVSAAVWIAAGGLIAYHFHIIVPVTVLANLWVVPLTGVIVAVGFTLILSGLILPAAAVYCALCVKFLLNLLAAGLVAADKLPGSSLALNSVNIWYIMAYYLFIILVYTWCARIKRKSQSGSSLIDKAWHLS